MKVNRFCVMITVMSTFKISFICVVSCCHTFQWCGMTGQKNLFISYIVAMDHNIVLPVLSFAIHDNCGLFHSYCLRGLAIGR